MLKKISLIFLLCHVQTNRSHELIEIVSESSCRKFSDKVFSHNCTNSFKGKHPTISVQLVFSEDIQHLLLKANIRSLIGANHKFEYRNLRLDLCNFLKVSAKSNIFGIFLQGLQKSARNIPQACPFKKNTSYAFEDFSLNHDNFVGFADRNKLRVTVDAYEGNIKLLQLKVHAHACLIDKPSKLKNVTDCKEGNF